MVACTQSAGPTTPAPAVTILSATVVGVHPDSSPEPATAEAATEAAPPPTVDAGPAGAVASLTLVDADTDQPIAGFNPIPANAIINLAALPTSNLNIVANVATNGPAIESVRFDYDGSTPFPIENAPPYVLAGDIAGDYNPWTPTAGPHTLTAVPYPADGAQGTAGPALTITFTVTNP